MIRVLHMIGTLGIGGSQAFVMNMYRAINREEMQFDFIIDHPHLNYYIPEIEKMGGRVYQLPLFNGKNFFHVRKAWKKFFETHPEYKILHSHVRSYASIYLPIAREHGVKTIIHSHATSNGKGFYAAVKAVLQFPLRFQADCYMACSHAAGEWLFGKRICRSNKFKLIKNAINTEEFVFEEKKRTEICKEFGIDKQFVVGFLARVSEAKNPMFALDVIKHLSGIKPDSVMLFVGDGEMLSEVKKRAKELGLESRVIFTGARTDTGKLLSAMDCYILPSLWEGLGISLIEAQVSGIQCICSEAIQDEAIITENVHRLSLASGARCWADYIADLDNTNRRSDCAKNAIEAGFDVRSNAEYMQNLYRSLINDESGEDS